MGNVSMRCGTPAAVATARTFIDTDWSFRSAERAAATSARGIFKYVTILTVGYMISRGLAKSGSREPYDEDR